MDRYQGRVWRFGDHVDTDQIIPAERLTSDNNDRLGRYIFEKARPDMSARIKPGDIIVAGRNFGCGSSREHAPRAILQAGMKCVIAESYARIFFRNSINVGLLPIECKIEAAEGDVIIIDTVASRITNKTTGKEWGFAPFPAFVKDLIEKGGLMAKIKEERRCSK
jgi:3-isopropylmalate/(R)-2-methylmalate dehydratase small subunit